MLGDAEELRVGEVAFAHAGVVCVGDEALAERGLPGNGNTSLWWVDAGFLAEVRAKALAMPRP